MHSFVNLTSIYLPDQDNFASMAENNNQGSNKRKAEDDSFEESELSCGFLENPEDHGKSTTVNHRLEALEKSVHGRGGIEQRLEEMEAVLADLTNEYCVLQKENRDLRDRNHLMESVILKQDKEIHELKKAQTDIVSRSMRNNIMLHNIKETDSENPEKVLKQFLAAKRILPEKEAQSLRFDRVHRMGEAAHGRSRPIVARLTYYKDKERIIRNWNALGQKDRKHPRVTQQVPTEVLAKRAQSHHLIEQKKASITDKKAKIKVTRKGEKLYINQQLVTPEVVKPSLAEVLVANADELAKARKLPHALSPQLHECGSVFQAEAVRVKSTSEVRLSYKRLLTCFDAARASHNVMAYKIGGHLGWEDDGEHGAGRFLAHLLDSKKADNICVFLTRQYGGERIGAKRFQLMKEAANLAYGSLAEQLHLE